MKGREVIHSHTRDSADGAEWGTPPEVLEALAKRWGRFCLDVCASDSNAKAPAYITKEINALAVDWTQHAVPGRTVFLNPPYSGGERACPPKGCAKKRCAKRGHHAPRDVPGIGEFMRKAREQAIRHGFTVVCLVPCRPETQWWRSQVIGAGAPSDWLGGMCLPDGERVMRWRNLETTITEWPERIGFLQPGRGSTQAPFPSAVVVYKGLAR